MISLLDNWPYFAALLVLLTIKALWCCGVNWSLIKETTDFVIKVTGFFCLGFAEQVGSILIPMIWPLDPDALWYGSMQPCLKKSCLEARGHGRQMGMIALLIVSVIAMFVVCIVTVGSIKDWIS